VGAEVDRKQGGSYEFKAEDQRLQKSKSKTTPKKQRLLL